MSALLFLCCIVWFSSPTLAVQYRPFRVMKGDQANLTCWESSSAADVQQWLSPDNKVLNPNDASVDPMKFEFDWDGMGGLRIMNAEKKDSGIYQCMQRRSPTGDYFITRTTLQVIDVTYIPEIDDWQSNLIRGLISAASMAAFFIISCAVHKYRWKPDDNDDEDCQVNRSSKSSSRRSSGRPRSNGIDNPAAQFEEAKEIDTGL